MSIYIYEYNWRSKLINHPKWVEHAFKVFSDDMLIIKCNYSFDVLLKLMFFKLIRNLIKNQKLKLFESSVECVGFSMSSSCSRNTAAGWPRLNNKQIFCKSRIAQTVFAENNSIQYPSSNWNINVRFVKVTNRFGSTSFE